MIICKLEVSGYGCRIARKHVGILMYADDLLLISASNCDLRKMIEICESEMAWLDRCFNINKSCLLRCGPRYKKPCVPILLNGNLLHEWSTVKYLGVTFETGLKLKVSLAAKRMKFFRAFNYIYIYACVGSTASPMLLCHLLHTYCLPILLYGLEAVTISNANRQTLYVTWKTALYKIFKLNDEVNLLYVQYCLGILPISYVFDLRRLCLLFKQSTRIISAHNIFTMCLAFLSLTNYVQFIL